MMAERGSKAPPEDIMLYHRKTRLSVEDEFLNDYRVALDFE
jgi:hypothetical protein